MTTKNEGAAKKTKSTAAKTPKRSARKNPERLLPGENKANCGLTGKQARGLWELIITGDGKSPSSVDLDKDDWEVLKDKKLVTVEKATRGSKLYVTDKGWVWANEQGFAATLTPTQALLETLLTKVGAYLKFHNLGLDELLRLRRAAPDEGAQAAVEEPIEPAPSAAEPTSLEERIRAAYLRRTGGKFNQHVKLAHLRAELPGETAGAVDAVLLQMQQKGATSLGRIDDPQALGPDDDTAALWIASVRRDLVRIER